MKLWRRGGGKHRERGGISSKGETEAVREAGEEPAAKREGAFELPVAVRILGSPRHALSSPRRIVCIFSPLCKQTASHRQRAALVDGLVYTHQALKTSQTHAQQRHTWSKL